MQKLPNFCVDKISRIEDLKFSCRFNFANQPIFHLIPFIFLGVLAKIEILKISRGQNFTKMASLDINPVSSNIAQLGGRVACKRIKKPAKILIS